MNNLKFYRKKANLTQCELAKKTNISQSKISNLETGTDYPNTSESTLIFIELEKHISNLDFNDVWGEGELKIYENNQKKEDKERFINILLEIKDKPSFIKRLKNQGFSDKQIHCFLVCTLVELH